MVNLVRWLRVLSGTFAISNYLGYHIYRDFCHWKCFRKIGTMATCLKLFKKLCEQNF